MTPARESPSLETRAIQALRVLGYSPDRRWIDWAEARLAAGDDTPALRIFAGLSEPFDYSETVAYFDRVIAELGLPQLAREEAPAALVVEEVRALAAGEDPSPHLARIYPFTLDPPGYRDELFQFYLFHWALQELIEEGVQHYVTARDLNELQKEIRTYSTRWLERVESRRVTTALIFGATGMVGIEVLHLALSDQRITHVQSIGRRATGVVHPKLREILHADQLALDPVADSLREADLILYCLGVYQNAVPADEFWTITCGYLEHLLAQLKRLDRDPVFCLMGAQGADPTEKSPFRFAKAKGRAERFLMESHLTRKYIFRPGYIMPGRGTSRSTTPEWIARPIFKLFPALGIEAVRLARVMLDVGLTRPEKVLYTNGEMRRYGLPRR